MIQSLKPSTDGGTDHDRRAARTTSPVVKATQRRGGEGETLKQERDTEAVIFSF